MMFACFLFFIILPSPGLAQTEDELEQQKAREQEAAIQAQHAAEEQQALEMMRRGQAELDEFLKGTVVAPRTQSDEAALQKARFRDFRLAVPKFRKATANLRWAIGSSANVGMPAKEIGLQTEVLLKYLKGEKLKPPPTNSSEFKDYSKSELAWETLNSA